MIAIIAALDKNNAIGKDNDLPWYLPGDLAYFKQLTLGASVIAGRKTYQSIVARLGKPLPDRQNIVLSRKSFKADAGVVVVNSIESALHRATHDRTFVIGGGQIYEQAIKQADRLYITEVDVAVDGDVFFPTIDKAIWREVSRAHNQADDRHMYSYDHVVYDRAG